MGGDFLKTISDLFGISPSVRRRDGHLFLDAVDNCHHHDLYMDLLPQTNEEMQKIVDEWEKLSVFFIILKGCLGPIDG